MKTDPPNRYRIPPVSRKNQNSSLGMGGSASKSESVPTDPVAVTDRFMKDEVERARIERENELKEASTRQASEEEAKARTKERADALAAKAGLINKPLRCVEEEKAVVECVKQHQGDPLACFSAVERFEKCSKM